MKILVVGYGSMGRRRIRIVRELIPNCTFLCVDSNKSRLEQIMQDGLSAYSNLSDALSNNPDLAFVCTSPGHHADIILQLINAKVHTFTELNLTSDRYDEILQLASTKNVKIFMSNTNLYDKQILSIMDCIGTDSSHHAYSYHIGQYLPDWHPWESYKDFFIGKKETNGCREILAIQLPWLIKTFGKVKRLSTIKRKNTKLDIEFSDTYIITIEHENGTSGVFICDVLARKATTSLEIMSEENHIFWQGSPESLCKYNKLTNETEVITSYEKSEHLQEYAETIQENPYIDETKAFLDYCFNDIAPVYTLTDDKYILSLIDEIEG